MDLRLIAILVFLLTASGSFGHEYFFAFAEVEYNDVSQKFEATLIVSTHDLEETLKVKDESLGDLMHIEYGSTQQEVLETYLLKHFYIKSDENKAIMKLIGHEVSLDGTTNFYFESEPFALDESLRITFDLLMNEKEKQQNKLTLFIRDKSYTLPFLQSTRKQTIKLETN